MGQAAYSTSAPTAASTRLPLGVAVLSILIGLFGFFVLVVGLLVLLLGVGAGLAAGATVFGFTGELAGLVVFIVGLVILAVAVGLWNQELWALALAILVLLFYGAVEFLAGAWLGLLVTAVLLVYLVAVSSAFD
jgi:hypothetical protein